MLADKTLPPPIWVDTPELLEAMVGELLKEPRVAVDTESNSLHAFRERVCLIQFSTPVHDYLVDPLQLSDLSQLIPVFSNPDIEKIFHAAEYDLICLRRDFGFHVVHLFDTMHAARVLGYTAVGLDKLLSDKFQVQVDKRLQIDPQRRAISLPIQNHLHAATGLNHGFFEVIPQQVDAIGKTNISGIPRGQSQVRRGLEGKHRPQ